MIQIERANETNIYDANVVTVYEDFDTLVIGVSLHEDSSWFDGVDLDDELAVKTAVLMFFDIEGEDIVEQVRDWLEVYGVDLDDLDDFDSIELTCFLPVYVNYIYR